MKFVSIMGIIVLLILMVMYKWPKLKQKQKKEKAAFIILTSAAGGLSILIIIYPDMPGPTHLINIIYKPFGEILKE